MPSIPAPQLTLNFEPSLPDRWPTLREYVAYRAQIANKHMKAQAADMDMAPSTLSRKLNPAEGDTQRFNVDDLEAWIACTGEAPAIVEYLASKYMDSDMARQARAVSRAEDLLTELAKVLPQLRVAA